MEKVSYRHEYKHCINMSDFIALTGKISYIAAPDEHMKNDHYFIRSLYFDSPDDKALREKLDGTNIREKFRIRFYDMDDSFIRLEKKSKREGLCMKQTAPLTREKTERLIRGEWSFLSEEKEPLLNELYAKMSGGLLRPRLTVDYKRKAYVFPAGNVRVTFDYDIRSDSAANRFFSPQPAAFPSVGTIIMEVKYDEFLPQIIADITQLEGRQTGSFSKYAAGRLLSGV